MVVPVVMGLSKFHKSSMRVINNEKDEDKTPPPFISVQLGQEQKETYAFIDSVEWMVTPSPMSFFKH